MFLLIQALHLLIALLSILPCRVVFIFKEKSAIAGIFRVDIQLAGDNRPAHHRRGAELDFVNRFDAVAFQHLLDHITEQRPFGINFRADLHRLCRLQRHTYQGGQRQRAGPFRRHLHPASLSSFALRLQKLKRKA